MLASRQRELLAEMIELGARSAGACSMTRSLEERCMARARANNKRFPLRLEPAPKVNLSSPRIDRLCWSERVARARALLGSEGKNRLVKKGYCGRDLLLVVEIYSGNHSQIGGKATRSALCAQRLDFVVVLRLKAIKRQPVGS